MAKHMPRRISSLIEDARSSLEYAGRDETDKVIGDRHLQLSQASALLAIAMLLENEANARG